MLEKIGLYAWTIRYMKPEQVFWRVGKRLGLKCALKGSRPVRGTAPRQVVALPELDFDPVFLQRFDAEALMADRVTFLHETEAFAWDEPWKRPERAALWNFNLHYFEFLHPLVRRYLETGDEKFLRKTEQTIRGWMQQNPQSGGGDGWAAYTLSLRLTNWLAFYASLGNRLDEAFRKDMEESMYAQYVYLSGHLEKDILGNHYFENLKALVLCALFFGDADALPVYLAAFRAECREEILPDGMHFERSPMYHKIVLEGLLRVAVSLRAANMPDAELERLAGKMLTAACSMEQGLARTPLFNDSGDNVAKSLNALRRCAGQHLHLVPEYRASFPDSGFYIFTNHAWKLIVDAGAAGPDYIPGHAHCDAMSFELYRNGQPVLVNCGTYAYQCAERHWFRSTEAHNTVQIAGTEQSEIWSVFRLARRSKTQVLELRENGLRMEMTDYKGNRIQRDIRLEADALYIQDHAPGKQLQSRLHSINDINIESNATLLRGEAMYAPEYGLRQTIQQITAVGDGTVKLTIPLK
ncbi:MAG: alginate lyase family protein [Clostridia bacterium]|nr:alginate lyase family protein [Clostridia bacterium]